MTPVERSVLPDGREGVVIVVVERDRRRRHRFVLATDDAGGDRGVDPRASADIRAADEPAPTRRVTTADAAIVPRSASR